MTRFPRLWRGTQTMATTMQPGYDPPSMLMSQPVKENPMTDPLTLALGEDRLSDLYSELDDLRAEVQAHRDGVFHIALDPMRSGQVVEEHYDQRTGEPVYHLQVTCQGVPVWGCAQCQKLTISATWPERCSGCGADGKTNMGQETYEKPATCRSWTAERGGQYDGPCLIAGSDGCECPEVAR